MKYVTAAPAANPKSSASAFSPKLGSSNLNPVIKAPAATPITAMKNTCGVNRPARRVGRLLQSISKVYRYRAAALLLELMESKAFKEQLTYLQEMTAKADQCWQGSQTL